MTRTGVQIHLHIRVQVVTQELDDGHHSLSYRRQRIQDGDDLYVCRTVQ